MSTIYGESKIVFGFPGVGKTYAFQQMDGHGLDLQDSDSSHFHWLYPDGDESFEHPIKDEDGKNIPHPAWPENYAQYIELTGREQKVKPDFIFVSTHPEVIEAIGSRGFVSYLLVPDKADKMVYLQRYRERGNDEKFISNMEMNWDKFIDQATSLAMKNNINVVVLKQSNRVKTVLDFIQLIDPMMEEDTDEPEEGKATDALMVIAMRAAEWWADKICHPRFDAGEELEMGSMLAGMLARPVDNDDRQRFTYKLADLIYTKLQEDDRCIVECDYHPDQILGEALSLIGKENNAPWKTAMIINKNGRIQAKCGYGQPLEDIR